MTVDETQYFKDNWFKDSEHLMKEPSVIRLMQTVLELQERLKEAEEGNVPMYCPTCTSCGEAGCCSPDACEAVKCLYESSNLRSYYQAQMENNILWDFLESFKLIIEPELQWLIRDANATEEKIHDIWSLKFPELESKFKNKIG